MTLRRTALTVLLLAVASILPAQDLTTFLCLPDSFARVTWPTHVIVNPVNGLTYVAGDSPWVVALARRDGGRVAALPADEECYDLCVNPVQNKLYHTSWYGVLSIIDCDSHTRTASVTVPSDGASLCYNPGAGRVYCAGDTKGRGRVLAIDGISDQVVDSLETELLMGGYDYFPLACSPVSNRLFVAVEKDTFLYLLSLDGSDLASADTLLLTPYGYEFLGICYDSAHELVHLALADEDDFVVLVMVDAATNRVTATVATREDAEELAGFIHNPASNKLYVGLASSAKVLIVDISNREVADVLHCGVDLRGMAFDPVLNRLFFTTEDDFGRMFVIDGTTDRWVAELDSLDLPVDELTHRTMTCDPSAGLLYVLSGERHFVYAFDTQTCSLTGRIPTGVEVTAAAACPELDKLYYANYHSDLWALDLATLTSRGPVEGLANGSSRLAAAPGIGRVYSGYRDFLTEESHLSVIDCATDSEVLRLLQGSDEYLYPCYCSGENKLYCLRFTGRTDGSIVVLDCSTYSELARFPFDSRHRLEYDSATGCIYAVAGSGLAVLDARRDSIVAQRGFEGWIEDYTVCPPGQLVCLGLRIGDAGQIAWYRPGSDAVAATLQLRGTPLAVEYNRTMNLVYCVAAEYDTAGAVYLLAVEPGADTTLDSIRLATADWLQECRLFHSPVSNLLYYLDRRGNGGVVDCWTNEVVRRYEFGSDIRPATFFLDEAGGRVFAATSHGVAVFRDRASGHAARGDAGPTLVGRTVTLLGTTDADLLDITGRRLAVLRPGPNSLGAFPAGVYFVHHRETDRTQKIIIRR